MDDKISTRCMPNAANNTPRRARLRNNKLNTACIKSRATAKNLDLDMPNTKSGESNQPGLFGNGAIPKCVKLSTTDVFYICFEKNILPDLSLSRVKKDIYVCIKINLEKKGYKQNIVKKIYL